MDKSYKPKRRTENWSYIKDNCIEINYKKIYKLNQIASFIWNLCDGYHTVEGIIRHIIQKCNLKDNAYNEVASDVTETLLVWNYEGLLICNYNPLHSLLEYQATEYDIKANSNKLLDLMLIFPPTPTPMTYGAKINSMEPLGIAYITAYLQKNGLTNIEYYNWWTEQLNRPTIEKYLKLHKPKVIGISAMTDNFQNGMRISQIAKELDPEVKIIVGGPHATFEDENILKQYLYIDYIVRGEGEITMLELMKYLLYGEGSINQICGITYRYEDSIARNSDRQLIENLDVLPFPKRNKLPLNSFVGIQTSRGCVGKCIFCCASLLSGGKYRMRSAENVVDEIEVLYRNKVQSFFFQDDTVTVDIKRLNLIIDLLHERKLDIIWRAESRVDVLAKNLWIIDKMYDSGCSGLQFGIESGSQKMLDELRKNIRIEDVLKVVRYTIKVGIPVTCSFLIGHPFETESSIFETLEFAKYIAEMGASVGLSTVCPYPGTEIRRNSKEYGLVIKDTQFQDYTTLNAIMDTPYLTADKIRRLAYLCNKELFSIMDRRGN